MNKELTTGEKNDIIAAYMGWINVFDYYNPSDKAKTNHYTNGKQKILFSDFWAYLDYHNSFDSLMPVVKMVMLYRSAFPLSMSFNIQNALRECYKDIKPLYEATFNAIQYLNQLKQTQP